MTNSEFSNQFDVLYNNIMSNQAPGLNEYEKSIFLTKAQDEIVKNYFNPSSNPKQQGFDDTAKRQMDFANIMKTVEVKYAEDGDITHFDSRSVLYELPDDIFAIVNENIKLSKVTGISIPNNIGTLGAGSNSGILNPIDPADPTKDDTQSMDLVSTTEIGERQIIAIDFSEYSRLMSKPYKYPLKYQAWRLITNGINSNIYAEIILPYIEGLNTSVIGKTTKWDGVNTEASVNDIIPTYNIRYVRRPNPIRLVDLTNVYGEGLTIGGGTTPSECELGEGLHEEILQRAVELAKIAWTGDAANSMQAGQRSE